MKLPEEKLVCIMEVLGNVLELSNILASKSILDQSPYYSETETCYTIHFDILKEELKNEDS